MRKLLSVALAAVALATHSSFAHAVVWSFNETSCTIEPGLPCQGSSGSPAPLASMTLSGPTSSGSASWHPFPNSVLPPPVLTGDSDFVFTASLGVTVSPPTYEPPSFIRAIVAGAPAFYDLSWNEAGGQFSMSVSLADLEYAINFFDPGPSPWVVETNFDINDCPALATCVFTGVWQSNLFPEPRSAALLLSGLLVTWQHGWPATCVLRDTTT